MEASRYSNYYDNVTTLHPLALAMLGVAIILVFVLPRRQIFLPLILLTCLVPAAQRIVIAGADFHFLRIMIVVAWARVLFRGEQRKLIWNNLDKTLIAWIVMVAVATILRRGSTGAFVNQAGRVFDCLGIYFLARATIRNWRDLDSLVVSFILVSVPVAAFSIYEVWTETNPFHIFGQATYEAIMRDGRVRARGAFSHQILAGCYWVSVLPLITARFWQQRTSKLLTGMGFVACWIIVINCSSTTPLLGAGITMVGAACYLVRGRMHLVRRGIVLVLFGLQAIMDKPIWHLYHRVGAIGLGASTGYHRFRLIDAFVGNFKQWAVLGVNSTASWGRQLEDVTNHFVAQGVRGGLMGFVLFIAMISYAFKYAGQCVRAAGRNRPRAIYAWGLGCAVLAHSAMMTATSYFGQILLPFYVTLAAISCLASVRGRRSVRPGSQGTPAPASISALLT